MSDLFLSLWVQKIQRQHEHSIPTFLSMLLCVLALLTSTLSLAEPSPLDLKSLLVRAKELHLAQDPQWMRLGYYDKGTFGGFSSRSSEAFFLAPDGATQPEHEFEATIQALFSTEGRTFPVYRGEQVLSETQIPRCQFPARYRWITEVLSIDQKQLPTIECPTLEKFRQRLGAKSASIVFSSFYLNSPSSAFGHTMIRISKNPPSNAQTTSPSERIELLDFGFGYAADVTTNNAFLFAAYGLLGLFKGSYTNIPYYYKVREYNNFESRDLWSYELNLTQKELDLLVDRMWELGPITHQYYYFTFNCSNVLLYALEAAAPRYPLITGLKYYVIPSDIIKHVAQIPGLVSRITYRPSSYSQFMRKSSLLDSTSLAALEATIQNHFELPQATVLTVAQKLNVLETAVDYIDYQYAKEVEVKNSESSAWRQNLLVQRAEIPIQSSSTDSYIPDEQRPERGHPSSRFGMQFGNEQLVGKYLQMNLRFSLHDSLDPPVGYPKYSQIEMLGTKLRYLTDLNTLELEEINLFRILSISPYQTFNRGISWRVALGTQRIRDQNCSRCYGAALEGGGGLAVELAQNFVGYTLGEVAVTYAPGFYGSSLNFGMGPSVGAIWNTSLFAFGANAKYLYRVFAVQPQNFELSSEFRYHPGTQWMVGVLGKVYSTAWDLGTHFSVYF